MTKHTVTFLPHQVAIEVPGGTTVIQAALDAGVHINASCGGEGVCGKCRVRVEEGVVDDGISEKLSAEDIEAGYRLACRARVTGNLTLRVPTESAVDTSVLNRAPSPAADRPHPEVRLQQSQGAGAFSGAGGEKIPGNSAPLGPGQPAGSHPADRPPQAQAR